MIAAANEEQGEKEKTVTMGSLLLWTYRLAHRSRSMSAGCASKGGDDLWRQGDIRVTDDSIWS